MRSSILARIPGFRQRIIPEPRVPSRGSQAQGTRLDFDLFLSVHQDVVIPGGNGRGECEKNIKLRAHNMQTFYSGLQNIRTFPEETRLGKYGFISLC